MPTSAVSPFDIEDGSEALTPLQAHYRGYLKATWAAREDEAEYHWACIDRIERGLPAEAD